MMDGWYHGNDFLLPLSETILFELESLQAHLLLHSLRRCQSLLRSTYEIIIIIQFN